MILGISGKRGVGKTLGAMHLVKAHGFVRVSFAEELKILAKQIFPFKENDLVVPSKKESKFMDYDWTPREFMINLGEFCRFHDNEYWIKRGLSKCNKDDKHYVFDDVRYKNEANAIRERGGLVIRINRYEKQNPYGKDLDVPSETDLDDYKFDFVVDKMWNTSKEELYRQLDSFKEERCPKT